jgi:hypothetical protein
MTGKRTKPPMMTTQCAGDEMQERALIKLHNEGSDAMRALRSAQGRYSAQIVEADELGYSRGLNDGLKQANQGGQK